MWSYHKAVDAIEKLGLSESNFKFSLYWLSLWSEQTPPTRAAFNPDRVRDLLPGVALVEVHANGDPICRLSGTAIDAGLGRSLTGQNLLDFVSGEAKELRRSRVTTTVAGSISVSRKSYTQAGKSKILETAQFPFFGLTEVGSRLLIGHINWRPLDGLADPAPSYDPLALPETHLSLPFTR